MRRVGRTADIALRVNAHIKREIEGYAEGNQICAGSDFRAEGSHAAGSASHRGGIQLEAACFVDGALN